MKELLKKYWWIVLIILIIVLIVSVFVVQDFIVSMTIASGAAAVVLKTLQDKMKLWKDKDAEVKKDVEVYNTLIDNIDDSDLSSEIDSAVKRRNRKTRKN